MTMDLGLRKGYSGGEELRRAAAALAGPSAGKQSSTKSITEEEEVGPVPVPLPVQLEDNADAVIRELAYAAQKYGRMAAVDPSNSDAIYNHGLALQELALRASTSRTDQEKLLQQASGRYQAAWKLQPSSHAALYNWGVALSDLARVVKAAQKDSAHSYLQQAGDKYQMSLKLHPHNPQALNNWGLVLFELSGTKPPAEQRRLILQSIARFRSALRLRPEFDRAWYNLGTVFYAFASSQQASVTQRLPSSVTQDPEQEETERKDTAASQLSFQLASQYVLFAHALQPSKDVYKKSISVTLSYLPLPFVRSGELQAVDPRTANTCEERWICRRYVLDEQGFRSHESGPDSEHQSTRFDLKDISTAVRVSDPSVPDGYAFWIGLKDRPLGQFFVAELKEEAEGWVDAIVLCSHLASSKRLAALKAALEKPAEISRRDSRTDRRDSKSEKRETRGSGNR